MKTYIFLITALMVSCGTNSECRKFHSGKFVILSAAGNRTIILRTDSTQTEYSEETGAGEIMKIRWLDDCTYELYEPRDKKTGKKFPIDIRVKGEIYDISGDSYFVKVTGNLSDKEMKTEVRMIKPE